MAARTLYSRQESQQKEGRRMCIADERECLARALQETVVYIVENLYFTESNLPDQLISSGQITEDECSQIRNMRSRKDQIRYLVNRTKRRDLKDIKKVIEWIGKQIPDVVDKIYEKFEDYKAKHVRCTTCALCQCFTAIDIKDVIDYIWSERGVSDEFYTEVIFNSAPIGCQTKLWKRLIENINQLEVEKKKEVYNSLFIAILSRGNFEFLVNPMRRSLGKCSSLKCKCFSAKNIYYPPMTSASTDSQPSTTSSYSARSSTSSLSSSSTCCDDDNEANDHSESQHRDLQMTMLKPQGNDHNEVVRLQQKNMRMKLLKPQDFTSIKKTKVLDSNQWSGNCDIGTHTEDKSSQTENETSVSSNECIPDEVVLRNPKVGTIKMQADSVNINRRNSSRHGRNMEGIAALKPGNIEDWINIMKAETCLDKSKRTGKNLDSIAATSIRQDEEWIDILTSEYILDNAKRYGRNLDGVAAADPNYVADWIKVLTTGKLSG